MWRAGLAEAGDQPTLSRAFALWSFVGESVLSTAIEGPGPKTPELPRELPIRLRAQSKLQVEAPPGRAPLFPPLVLIQHSPSSTDGAGKVSSPCSPIAVLHTAVDRAEMIAHLQWATIDVGESRKAP